MGPARTEALNRGLKDFVLNKFNRHERSLLPALIVKAAEACECWLKEGLQSAMNKFNARVMKGE
jgi:peptidyl-tRNA hydrolase